MREGVPLTRIQEAGSPPEKAKGNRPEEAAPGRFEGADSEDAYARRLESLRKIDGAILQAESPLEIAHSVLEHISDLVPNRLSGIVLFDFDRRKLEWLGAYRDGSPLPDKRLPLDYEDFGKIETMVESGPVLVRNVEGQDRLSPSDRYLVSQGIRSYMMIPLVREEAVTGALMMGSATPDFFKPAHFETASELASLLSISLKQAELYAELHASRERYSLAEMATQDGLWDHDLETGEVYYSERFLAMLGIRDEGSRRTLDTWYSRLTKDGKVKLRSKLSSAILQNKAGFKAELRLDSEKGEPRWFLCRAIIVRGEQGKATRVVGAVSDITVRKQLEVQLRHDAFHDSLTQLPNRTLFTEHLERAVNKGLRDTTPTFAVFFIDLDRFKVVNDTHGHEVGDALLVEVGRRLNKGTRPGDLVARLGGDEFAVLVDDLSKGRSIQQVATPLLELIRTPFFVRGLRLFLKGSIGISLNRGTARTAGDYLRDADIAMYRAKGKGDCFEVYDEQMHQTIVHHLKLETELKSAIDEDAVRFTFQPIVNLLESRIVGFEALARWQHPTLGEILPDEFIPIAEEAGFIEDVSAACFNHACDLLRKLEALPPPFASLAVNVNLSNKEFLSGRLADRIARILSLNGIDASRLTLEITESALMENPTETGKILSRLRAMGSRVYLDDFGVGYSSLSYLLDHPIDGLKIDRSFVKGITGVRRSREIVMAILSMARSLNMAVAAEGIETAAQAARLIEMGCMAGQGYHYSKPLTRDEALRLVRSQADG